MIYVSRVGEHSHHWACEISSISFCLHLYIRLVLVPKISTHPQHRQTHIGGLSLNWEARDVEICARSELLGLSSARCGSWFSEFAMGGGRGYTNALRKKQLLSMHHGQNRIYVDVTKCCVLILLAVHFLGAPADLEPCARGHRSPRRRRRTRLARCWGHLEVLNTSGDPA